MRKLSILLACVTTVVAVIGWVSTSSEVDVGSSSLTSQPMSLWCVGSANATLNQEGFAVIRPQTLLIGSYPDYGIFEVTITNPALNTDTVRCDLVGQYVEVMVTDTTNGNSCWSNVLVEDKLDPIVTCTDVTLPCTTDPLTVSDTFLPVAADNCTDTADLTYEIIALQEGPLPCNSGNPYIYRIQRTWRVTDASGNYSTCDQEINFMRPSLTDVDFPANDTVYCPNADTSAAALGMPTLGGLPIINGNACMLVVHREPDQIVSKCNGAYGIRRVWSVIDWCSGDDVSMAQLIDVLDTTAPVIICPSDMVIGSDDNCEANIILPIPSITDACSGTTTYTVRVNGVPSNHNLPVSLGLGMHHIVYTARDDCGNTASCTQTITVEDQLSPTCNGCSPLSITVDSTGGMQSINIHDLTSCPFDANCGTLVDTTIRRMTDRCGRPQDLQYGDEVYFCCNDIGTDVMVQIRIEDNSGNVGFCMIPVTVKGDAFVLECPDDRTVNCDEFNINDDYGDATFGSNCGQTIERDSSFSGMDQCGRGTYRRVWRVMSLGGAVDSCEQLINIINPYSFGPANINFPNDITIQCPTAPTIANTGSIVINPDPRECRTITSNFMDSIPSGQEPNCYTFFRIWTVTEGCDPGNPIVDIQRITIEDNIDPVITCPADVTLQCDADTTPANTGFPTAFDNCIGTITNFTRSDVITPGTGIVLYTIQRTWSTNDNCGNSASCTQSITVSDDDDPSINCPPDVTVDAAQGSCNALVNLPSATASDCSGIASITNNYNGGGANASGVYDVGTTTVVFTATTNSGQTVQCSTTVTVVDNVDPTISCPADVTVNCDDPLFPLSQFGSATASDNCPNFVITEDSVINIQGCDGGTVVRTFTVTDASSNTDVCTQTITVQGATVLDSLDVNWPASVVSIYDCIDIDDVPEDDITLNSGAACNSIIVTVTDMMLDPATIGCMDFIRSYTVRDSCNFDPVTGAGQWVFEQTIAIFDTVAPVITPIPQPDTFYADTNSCDAAVTLAALTATDCNTFTITNNSLFATSGGADASGTYPEGTTTVTYTVTDKCDNVSTFSLDIIVKDTVPPRLVCQKLEYVIPDSNGLFLTAIEISDTAYDNCTAYEDLIFTFDPNDLTDSVRHFPCDSAGTSQRLPVWVFDESGNMDSCVDVTGISDRNNVCPDSTMTLITGQVSDALSSPLAGVSMLMQMEGALYETSTASGGDYAFEQVQGEMPIKVQADLIDHVLNGISAYDLSLLQRHIVGLEPLDNGYLEMAADVTGDRKTDIRDVAMLRQLLLGLIDDLNVPTWRFYDASYDVNIIDPLQADVPTHIMIYDQWATLGVDFVGIKSGDLDLSAELTADGASSRYQSTIDIELHPQAADVMDEMLTVAVTMGGQDEIMGGQFHIELPRGYQITSVRPNEALGLTDAHINTTTWSESALRMVWSQSDAILPGDVLCWVTVKQASLERTWTLNERFLAECFDADGTKYGIRLRQYPVEVTKTSTQAPSFELHQNVPNPFTGETVIRYDLPQAAQVTMSLFDATGALIHRSVSPGQAGTNEIRLSADELSGHDGLIYYQIQTDEFSAIRRMMRIK